MKRRSLTTALIACLLGVLLLSAQTDAAKPPPAPRAFFGIGPQDFVTAEDFEYMRAGGIGSMRTAVSWMGIQPTRNGGYNWSGVDSLVEAATRERIRILPFFYQTPTWLSREWQRLPVDNARQRSAWRAFLRAAVQRYGPGGDFWAERAPGVAEPGKEIANPLPIRTWQIWNEANFFYFAFPVSPGRYAKLIDISGRAIKSVDRGAKVLLGGLFGDPDEGGRRGMDADDFLDALYRKPGIESRFDGIALHPYAISARAMARMIEGIDRVVRRNGDRPQLYLTEFGWGSEDNFHNVAFEQGVRGQVKQLRDSYRYLLENRRRLRLRETYWFSWKDVSESCNFCDSVGLFHAGEKFQAKPAWHAFVRIAGGRARP